MYEKILAPLDGSKWAECTLEHIRAVAAGCGAQEVILLNVMEPIPPTPGAAGEFGGYDYPADSEKRAKDAIEAYLSKLVTSLKKDGIAAQGVIVSDQPAADGIVDYAKKNKADLIIMSTHGRSGPSRWLLGSVAEKVIRHSEVPLLIVTPLGCKISE